MYIYKSIYIRCERRRNYYPPINKGKRKKKNKTKQSDKQKRTSTHLTAEKLPNEQSNNNEKKKNV